jgi:hypothetical protein
VNFIVIFCGKISPHGDKKKRDYNLHKGYFGGWGDGPKLPYFDKKKLKLP